MGHKDILPLWKYFSISEAQVLYRRAKVYEYSTRYRRTSILRSLRGNSLLKNGLLNFTAALEQSILVVINW